MIAREADRGADAAAPEEASSPGDLRASPAALDGYEQLQAMRAGGLQAPIARTLGFALVALERGAATFEGRPDASVYNPIGSVHGGYAATLLDSACGIAVHSRLGVGQGYTTLELKVAYHRRLTHDSGPVRAEGRVVTMGRRTAFAEGKLFDREGRLCASATSTLLLLAAGPTEAPAG